MANQDIILDIQLTASSYFIADYGPASGRLQGNGWCASKPSSNDWLQVDLGKAFDVCAVATQGGAGGDRTVTAFKLSYSSDGSLWTTYKDGNGLEMVRIYSIDIRK